MGWPTVGPEQFDLSLNKACELAYEKNKQFKAAPCSAGETKEQHDKCLTRILGPGIMLIKPRDIKNLEPIVRTMQQWDNDGVNFGDPLDPTYADYSAAIGRPGYVATHRFNTLAVMFNDANGRMHAIERRVRDRYYEAMGAIDLLVGISDYTINDTAKIMVERAGSMIEKDEAAKKYISTKPPEKNPEPKPS